MNFAGDIRTHFSIGESLLTATQAAKLTRDAGFDAAAIVDTMSLSAMPDFTKAANDNGLKPVIGVRLRIVDTLEKVKKQKAVFPMLYILTDEGFRIVTKLLTLANEEEEHFYYVPRLTWEDVFAALEGAEGHLAFATGTLYSALRHPDAHDIMKRIGALLGRSQTLLHVVPSHSAVWDRQALVAYQLAEKLDLPILPTRPMIFETKGMWDSLGVMNAIATNAKARGSFQAWVDDYAAESPKALIADTIKQFKRLQEKMGLDVPPDILREYQTTWDNLVAKTQFQWHKMDVSLPKMHEDEPAYLRSLAIEGLKQRLSSPVFGYRPPREKIEAYKQRLRYELDTLTHMGFSGYFLLVRDIVMWSKTNDIMVGPGRGSVGGSLLAYVLGITDVDPLRFDLIFERFINPERIDLPDIDLDFMSERRHEIITYCEETFGKDRVAGISNYSSLGSRAALQDVARILDLPIEDRFISKTIPEEQGTAVPLERAIVEIPEVAEFAKRQPRAWELARILEGRMRTLSRHAAGVVVAGEPLVNRAVVEFRRNEPTVNWDKRVVEDMGLIKIDVLGLSTLDLIKLALRKIEDRGHTPPDLLTIPLDDEQVLRNFGQGKTVGVFQFESGGMQRLLRDLARGGPLTFDDLAAATALYRPGPMESGLMDTFVAIRQGHMMADYDHDLMRPALEETQSVIIYQEQVMRISRDLCGFTGPEADHLRKAIGKKDKDKMATMGDKFVAGAVANGMNEDKAQNLWDKIVKFAGYSFNKSHSVEYSLISYQTMWLKTYHPIEFFAAAMTIADEKKMPGLLMDAERMGFRVSPPDINRSSAEFEIANDETILAPLSAVKGLSAKGTELIMEERKKGKFTSMEDFEARLPARNVNKTVRDKLDRVGAFALITPSAPIATDPRRREDQLQFIPSVMLGGAIVTRTLPRDKVTMDALRACLREGKTSSDPIISGATFSVPKVGKEPRFMVVSDGPSWSEESALKFTAGKSFETVDVILDQVGLDVDDGYWTGLCKAPKMAGEKIYTQAQINAYAPILRREIEIFKPQAIITLGTAAMRFFQPKIKGGCADNAGKVIYVPRSAPEVDDDYNLIIGITPGMISFDESKAELLIDAFEKLREMVY